MGVAGRWPCRWHEHPTGFYRVTGWEDATVPVGTVSGHTYKAFWYVPPAKKWTKSVEEYYDGNGRLYQRFTSELISYQVAL